MTESLVVNPFFTLEELIIKLPEIHKEALKWFFISSNRIIDSWPGNVNGTLVASKAKGIYKPKWSNYALSIRQALSSTYKDKEPETRDDGSWSYVYFQEKEDPALKNGVYTNRALMECLKDKVPIGVIRQTRGKPNVQYQILGLALVTSWDNGYFFLEGFSNQGFCHNRDVYIPKIITEQIQLGEEPSWFDYSNIIDARSKINLSIVIRRGQAIFRKIMLDEYYGKCAISDCNVEEVLEAAHIIPYKGSYTDNPLNGILLRADIHVLFDLGLLTIKPETLEVEIHPKLKGTSYFEYAGKKIRRSRSGGPSFESLDFHRRWSKGESL